MTITFSIAAKSSTNKSSIKFGQSQTEKMRVEIWPSWQKKNANK